MSEEKCTFVQNLSSAFNSSQIIMNRDLTQSNIERQNILNNRFAVDNIAKSLDVIGMLFEGEYRFTKQMVADFYQVDERTIERCVEQNIDELKHNGYILSKGKQLKDLKLQFAHVINVGSKTTQFALFNFRSFLKLLPIMQCIVDCTDFSESLKLDIAHAMSNGEIGTNENDSKL